MSVSDIVGLAHVVLGALGVMSAGMAIVFMGAFTVEVLAGSILLLVVAALMVLAGLWIRDGRRRGAILAAALDAGRLVLLVLTSAGFGVDMVLTIGLLISVIWVWPTLATSSPT